MGMIREEIEITGIRKSAKMLALFDSGAFKNYIRIEQDEGQGPDDIGFHIYEGKHDAILADGSIAPGESVIFKELTIKGLKVQNPRFIMMPNLMSSAIIGAEIMQELGIILDLPEEKLIIKEKRKPSR